MLSSGEVSEIKPSAMLKVKVLNFLCEEACASAAMHVIVDQVQLLQKVVRGNETYLRGIICVYRGIICV